MNRTIVFCAGCIVGGAITGFAGGWFAHKHMTKKASEQPVGELKSVPKEVIEDTESTVVDDEASSSDDGEDDSRSSLAYEHGSAKVWHQYKNVLETEYSQEEDYDHPVEEDPRPVLGSSYMIQKAVEEEEEDRSDNFDEEHDWVIDHRKPSDMPPYVIPRQEFMDGFQGYEQDDMITYYVDDDVFADKKDDVIENPEMLFGANIRELFGESDEDDEDVVCIRDDYREMEYEITRVHNAYWRLVGGVETED